MGKKAGLSYDVVLDAAELVADRDGLDDLTLASVATELGIRSPSLYTYVQGLDGMKRALGFRALETVAEYCEKAIADTDVADTALRKVCHAYRRFALDHPGLYQAMETGRRLANDDELWAAATTALGPVMETVEGLDLRDETSVWHAFRIIRATMHGFISLELQRGFALDIEADDSFDRLVDVMVSGTISVLGTPGERRREDKDHAVVRRGDPPRRITD